MNRSRLSSLLVLGGAFLGLVFAAYSTSDYAAHLDRQIHAVHCSFIPGADASADADNACKAALFSPYSALFRQTATGAGFPSRSSRWAPSASSRRSASTSCSPRRERRSARGRCSASPGSDRSLASRVMFTISATKLARFCKVCVGIYASSALVAAGAVLAWLVLRDEARTKAQRPEGSLVLAGGLFVALGVASLLPAIVYASALPDVPSVPLECGTLAVQAEPHNALLKLPTAHADAPGDALRGSALPDVQGLPRAARGRGDASSSSTSRSCSSRSTPSATGCSTGASTRARASSRKACSAARTARARSSSGRSTTRRTCAPLGKADPKALGSASTSSSAPTSARASTTEDHDPPQPALPLRLEQPRPDLDAADVPRARRASATRTRISV